MGTTADKIAKLVIAQQRSGFIDVSSYRATTASPTGEADLEKDRLRDLLGQGYDPAHAALIYAQNFVLS